MALLDKMSATKQMLQHMVHDEKDLIPTVEQMADKILEIQFKFLREGRGAEWTRVQEILAPVIRDEMEEWLRVQMFNLKTAKEIKDAD